MNAPNLDTVGPDMLGPHAMAALCLAMALYISWLVVGQVWLCALRRREAKAARVAERLRRERFDLALELTPLPPEAKAP